MAYIRKKAYDNAIQKVRVDFGTIIGQEKEEDAYVILKASTASEYGIEKSTLTLLSPGTGLPA